MLCFDLVTYYLNSKNEMTDIKYNMNYIKIFKIKRSFNTLDKFKKNILFIFK